MKVKCPICRRIMNKSEYPQHRLTKHPATTTTCSEADETYIVVDESYSSSFDGGGGSFDGGGSSGDF